MFAHPSHGISVSVHGDDFIATGPKDQLDWFETRPKSHYELTVGGRLGPGPTDDKEARVLNRIIRWTDNGLEYEADPRQAEKLFEEMELCGEGVKGSSHRAPSLCHVKTKTGWSCRKPNILASGRSPPEPIIWRRIVWTSYLRPRKFVDSWSSPRTLP